MNKNFLNKKISLKDIDLKKINLRNLKNKKEIIIGILVLIFIIVIIVIGGNLLDANKDAKTEYERLKNQYNMLERAPSEEALRAEIERLEAEKIETKNMVELSHAEQVYDVVDEFKKGAPISWKKDNEKIDFSFGKNKGDNSSHDICTVNINSFSATMSQIVDFMEYVKNYPRVVRIDSIGFRENQITGELNGQLRLSFYFKKLAE